MGGLIVLLSGRGSNLQAICKSGLGDQIKCVISNKATAKGLEFAKSQGIDTIVIDHTLYSSREEFDKVLAQHINRYNPELIILAGFMRILSSWFVNQYTHRLINIHPSLLPSFVGATAQADAVNAKVKISGATVHYVTDQLDHGPIIAQGVVQVKSDDNEETLSIRILALEHVIYSFVIRKILNKHVTIIDNKVIVKAEDSDLKYLDSYANQIFY